MDAFTESHEETRFDTLSTIGRIAPGPISLDKDGDAILEVDDPSSSRVVELRVSTKILSLASPVFAAMFGPRFTEGQRLDTAEPIHVKLEEDDASAMKTILQVLHYCRNTVAKPSSAKELACIAIHCDKYDCRVALSPWTYYWFHDFESSLLSSSEELSYVLLAAYKFDQWEHFSKISASAIERLTPGFPAKWHDHEMFSLLPEAVSDALTLQIQRQLNSLHSGLQAIITFLSESKIGYGMTLMHCLKCGRTPPIQAKACHPCSNPNLVREHCIGGSRVVEFIAVLQKVGLWPSVKPFESCSLNELFSRALQAKEVAKHSCDAGANCPLFVGLNRLRDKVVDVRGAIKSLCLKCIRQGKWDEGQACEHAV